jgi:hypothetical protein
MEVWKPIEGSKGFVEVSNEGRIRSLLRGSPRVLKAQTDKKGYLRITVTINRESITYKVHREVAKAFIPNPGKLPQVNHKNGNKKDNSVENLEWMTNRENVHHAIAMGLWDSVIAGAKRENESRKKPVIGRYDLDNTEIIKRFESVSEAERYLDSRHISDVLKGKRSHVKGWTFRYARGGDAECRH